MLYNWKGKVIHLELCKQLKFEHTNKWYMNKQESVLKNEIHKIIWDLDILTDDPIPSRIKELMLIYKK